MNHDELLPADERWILHDRCPGSGLVNVDGIPASMLYASGAETVNGRCPECKTLVILDYEGRYTDHAPPAGR